MAECIMRSLSTSARICLLPFRGNFEYNSVVHALLLHKKGMALATIDSVATTKNPLFESEGDSHLLCHSEGEHQASSHLL